MNRRMILFLLGRTMLILAALMTPVLIVALCYGEKEAHAFLITIAIMVAISFVLPRKRPKNGDIYAREGLVTVAATWIMISLFGALPMCLSGAIPSFTDAFFEMASGFTTTGASILSSVDELPRCALFWRSFSHWVGGMGVLVFMMAVLPLSDDRSMALMRAEVPGPVAGKIVPRMRQTAKILYGVYSGMTLLLFILLLCGGMPVFDALCNAFATAGTGGFAIRNSGISGYNSAYVEIVIAVFMLLFAINFNLYYLILLGKVKEALRNEELHWFLIIVAGATLTIAATVVKLYASFGESLRYAFFQVSAIVSTTGFATADFNLWPAYAQTVLVLLMFIGGCAGGTGGGFKVSRVIICVKSFFTELNYTLHPHAVTTVRIDRRPVDKSVIKGTRNYLCGYVLITIIVTLIISVLDGQYDFTTHFTATVSCFNNIGPGLNSVGPMENFGGYSVASKILLAFTMLAGRLEIFPIILLFSPRTWRKAN